MKRVKIIWLLTAMMALSGCGVKKRAAEPKVMAENEVSWYTCLITGTRARIVRESETLSSTIMMQAIRDSMIVVSVTPLMGMEMMRLEITPQLITGIDKIHGQYAEMTYEEINSKLRPALSWEVLQQLCTATLPTGEKSARMVYFLGDEPVELVLDYGERSIDVPVRVTKQNVSRYDRMIIK